MVNNFKKHNRSKKHNKSKRLNKNKKVNKLSLKKVKIGGRCCICKGGRGAYGTRCYDEPKYCCKHKKEMKKKLSKSRKSKKSNPRKSKRSKSSKRTKSKKMNKKMNKNMQMGGDGCSVSYVDIPGFSVGPLTFSQTSSPIEGVNIAQRRASLTKSCSSQGSKVNHAMTRI